MTVLTSILQSLRDATAYNRHELAAPRVILWPDEERLWTRCIQSLRASCPALWSLDDYAPDQATGPAVWLRYRLEIQKSDDVPVLYPRPAERTISASGRCSQLTWRWRGVPRGFQRAQYRLRWGMDRLDAVELEAARCRTRCPLDGWMVFMPSRGKLGCLRTSNG